MNKDLEIAVLFSGKGEGVGLGGIKANPLQTVQNCQASRIWRESPAFYLYFTQTFSIHFLYVHAFSFQLLTIHFFKIAADGTQIHAFYLLELGSYDRCFDAIK